MDIEKLTENELGQLSGGFRIVDSAPSDTNALVNNNCSGNAGLYNGNCGCKDCGTTTAAPDRA